MQKLEIRGGKKISGTIAISGSKNATLPILASTILTNKKVTIKNIPIVRDVETMVTLLKTIGSSVDLNKREKDIRKLISKIENCIIDILDEYKIKSYPDKQNIGIWVGDKNYSMKIAAIGIRVKKWVAYHGFSLNVCNDLSKYKGIIPCGIKNRGITSLKDMGVKNYRNIEEVIIKKFLNTFL